MSARIRFPDALPGDAREMLLTQEAMVFIRHLHDMFDEDRRQLLEKRKVYQSHINNGSRPDFLSATEKIRSGDWKVAPAPADLNDRRVEITGPTDRKMMINALNSGAKVFMADLEDSLSPSLENILEGQINLQKAVRRTIDFTANNGKCYQLKEKTATLVVRPRGWHLEDKHFLDVESGKYISASLLDFGLYFFHNARELLKRGSGPYFYLPKLEHHEEARLWNKVFTESQRYLKIPHGTVRATVLIETLTAAFQMEEILFELKDHASGLNAGRWDYIFSMIKKFQHLPEYMLSERKLITMTAPFMRSYTELLVKSCHSHGAHAIGGMSAFIPNRKLKEVNDTAIAAVTEDKQREARDGFDGTWVAHPDLVPVALQAFNQVLDTAPHQKHILKSTVNITQDQLLPDTAKEAFVTRDGVVNNIQVALCYIEKWLDGLGAVAINHLMEDAATAEISRAQLWQWIKHGVTMADGVQMSEELYRSIRSEIVNEMTIKQSRPTLKEAVHVLDDIVLDREFQEFLTIPAYQKLTSHSHISANSL